MEIAILLRFKSLSIRQLLPKPTMDSAVHPLNNCGACFSKAPKLYGRISGDIILFVSSKRRCLEARNFAVIFIFIPFTTCEKTSFTEQAGRNFTNSFSGPKSYRDFRETGPSCFG